METLVQTKDHREIQNWIEERGGRPALIRIDDDESSGILRIKFSPNEDDLDEISWDQFFEIFDQRDLTFLGATEKDSTFGKFIYDDE